MDTFCLALNIFPLDVVRALALLLAHCLRLTSSQCQGVVREFAPAVQYVFSRQPVPASVCADLRFCTPFGATETSSPRDAFMWRERLVRHRARRGAERQGKATEVKTSPGKPLQPLRKLRDPSIGYAFHISTWVPHTSVSLSVSLLLRECVVMNSLELVVRSLAHHVGRDLTHRRRHSLRSRLPPQYLRRLRLSALLPRWQR